MRQNTHSNHGCFVDNRIGLSKRSKTGAQKSATTRLP
jgi:hypothetical protein